MGSIDKALPLAGFYPDSQKRTSDAAKVQQFFDIAKFTISFSLKTWKFLSLYRRKEIAPAMQSMQSIAWEISVMTKRMW